MVQNYDTFYGLFLTNTIGIPLSHMALSDYRWGGVCTILLRRCKSVRAHAGGMEAKWWGHCILLVMTIVAQGWCKRIRGKNYTACHRSKCRILDAKFVSIKSYFFKVFQTKRVLVNRDHTISNMLNADFYYLSEMIKDYIGLVGAVKEVFQVFPFKICTF